PREPPRPRIPRRRGASSSLLSAPLQLRRGHPLRGEDARSGRARRPPRAPLPAQEAPASTPPGSGRKAAGRPSREASAMWRELVEQSGLALHEALAIQPPLSTVASSEVETGERP